MQIYLSSDLLLSLSLHIFVSVWLIKSLVHVGSVYRMTSLAVSRFSLQLAYVVRSCFNCIRVIYNIRQLLLKVVFFFNDCRNRLSEALSTDA